MAEPKSLHSCVTCLRVYLRSMSTLYEIMHTEAKILFYFFENFGNSGKVKQPFCSLLFFLLLTNTCSVSVCLAWVFF
jgi:hypothetical protein